MKTLILSLLLSASDAGSIIDVTSNSKFSAYWKTPDYWEEGPMLCGNYAKLRLEVRDGGHTYLVCDARDGGR